MWIGALSLPLSMLQSPDIYIITRRFLPARCEVRYEKNLILPPPGPLQTPLP